MLVQLYLLNLWMKIQQISRVLPWSLKAEKAQWVYSVSCNLSNVLMHLPHILQTLKLWFCTGNFICLVHTVQIYADRYIFKRFKCLTFKIYLFSVHTVSCMMHFPSGWKAFCILTYMLISISKGCVWGNILFSRRLQMSGLLAIKLLLNSNLYYYSLFSIQNMT